MRLLAMYYLEDAAEPQPEQAEALLLQAAELDDAESAYLLAEQYLSGCLTCADGAAAVSLLRQAARLGHYDAQLKLDQLCD